MTNVAEKGTLQQPGEELPASHVTRDHVRSDQRQTVTLDLVLAELRKQHFAVLSTADEDATPHSAGVSYGVSEAGGRIALYVMTRRHLRKTRNIARNPKVSLVIPVSHRFLSFLPPATIQVHGSAEILEWTDAVGTEVFSSFWVGRRILDSYREWSRRGETRICFLKITPDPDIATYMLGVSVWQLRTRMEKGIGKVTIPQERL